MQQIVDENGTLRHIILSALNNNGSTTPAATLVPQQQPQPFPYGHPSTCGASHTTSAYCCSCCCYGPCTGTPSAATVTSIPPPPPTAVPATALHNGVLAFPGQTTRRRTPNRSNFTYSNAKRSSVTSSSATTIGNDSVNAKSSPTKSKVAMSDIHPGLHVDAMTKMIIPSPSANAEQHTSVNSVHTKSPSSELISNSGDNGKNSSPKATPLQFNCASKSFQPKSPKTSKQVHDNYVAKDNCPHTSSLSVSPMSRSPMSVDSSSAGYASDKGADDFYCNGSMDALTLLPNGLSSTCDSRTSSSAAIDSADGASQLAAAEELMMNGGSFAKQSDSSALSTDTELSTLEVSMDSFNESGDSRNGSATNVELSMSVARRDTVANEGDESLKASPPTTKPANDAQRHATTKQSSDSPKKARGSPAKLKKADSSSELYDRKSRNNSSTPSSANQSPSKKSLANQKAALATASINNGASSESGKCGDKCKPNESSETSLKAGSSAPIAPVELDGDDRINVTIVNGKCSSDSLDRLSERRSLTRKREKQTQHRDRDRDRPSSASTSSSCASRASSEEKVPKPKPVIVANAVDGEPAVKPTEKATAAVATTTVPKPSPQRSPKHLLPQVQCLNLTYTALTASSVKLKWTHLAKELSEAAAEVGKESLFARQYSVEMVHNRGVGGGSAGGSTNGNDSASSSNNNSPVPTTRIVYQGTMNNCRVAHLNCQQQYSFRVRTVQDERAFVSNLLTITTPEQPQTKHKKSKQHFLQQQLQQQLQFQQQLLLHSQHQQGHEQHSQCEEEEEADPAERSDQRCAIIILLVFTLIAVVVAVMIQQLMI